MARARNIKPGFFTNEYLAELDFAARLLFIGLWTEADKEGRLEDRPKRLKMSLFPADSVDVDPMLADLERLGFIRRYENKNAKVIEIINWKKHQNPHHTEKESVLPPHPNAEEKECNSELTVNPPLTHESSTVEILLIPDSLIQENTCRPADADSDESVNFASFGKTPVGKKTTPRKTATEKTFDDWTKQITESCETAISETDPIFDYASNANIPEKFLMLAWNEFKNKFTGNDKKQKDWRATFRIYVRNNYLKLWWLDGEKYSLTTIGQQNMIAMENEKRAAA